jgi:hypothetical protein
MLPHGVGWMVGLAWDGMALTASAKIKIVHQLQFSISLKYIG